MKQHADCRGLAREFLSLTSKSLMRLGDFRVPFGGHTSTDVLENKAREGARKNRQRAFVLYFSPL